METPNYKESTINGTQYQRAVRVVAENPLNLPELNEFGMPSLLYVEEEVLVLSGKVVKTPIANIHVSFDPENPLHMQAYQILNAIYEEERSKRDALLQEPPDSN